MHRALSYRMRDGLGFFHEKDRSRIDRVVRVIADDVEVLVRNVEGVHRSAQMIGMVEALLERPVPQQIRLALEAQERESN